MFSTESLRLEDVVLSHHALVALVGHHQHRHLGGGEIALESGNVDGCRHGRGGRRWGLAGVSDRVHGFMRIYPVIAIHAIFSMICN